MCSGKIAVLSLLVPHKTGVEFMCSGKIAVISVLVPHKTEGEFMCSGKIAVYYRAYGSYHDFLERGMPLTRKQLNQGFIVVRPKQRVSSCVLER
jgi:hypothetical protein